MEIGDLVKVKTKIVKIERLMDKDGKIRTNYYVGKRAIMFDCMEVGEDDMEVIND